MVGASRIQSMVKAGNLLRWLADAEAQHSFSNRNRERRFQAFDEAIGRLSERLGRAVQIIDIGGTNSFWEQRGWAGRPSVNIVTVNTEAEVRVHVNVEPRHASATDLADFDDASFDVVFSNSVIEHLFSVGAQVAMAREVRRLAPRHWVQTPNYWFPVEPHFLAPGWHYLPERVRVALLRRGRWGWRGPLADPEEARASVQEIRLLRRRELELLFPESQIVDERFGPLVKSFVVMRGL